MPLSRSEILTPDNVGDSGVARRFGGIEAQFPQDLNPGLVMGIVAPPNTGKTTLAGTLRDSRLGLGVPALLLDSAANAHVLPGGDDIFRVKCGIGFNTPKALIEELKSGQHKDIKSLVLDHVTNMYATQVNDYHSGDQRQNYSKAMADLLAVTRDCVDLAESGRRLNVFFFFQEAQEKRIVIDEGNTKEIIRQEISLSDKMQTSWPNLVPLLAGLYIGMYVEPYPRVLDFTPSVNTMTKWQVRYSDTRLAALPILVWNPSLGRLLDVLVGGDEVPQEWVNRPRANLKKET